MPIKNANIFFVFVKVIVVLVLIGGCASRGPLETLKKDQLDQEHGYQSIVFWRIKIIDRTNSFGNQKFEFLPAFQFYENEILVRNPGRYKIWPNLKKSSWNGKILSGGWVKKDGVNYLDEMTIAEVKPGEYTLDSIYLLMSLVYKPSYYFTIDVNKTFDIPPGKLLYLGEFDVEFVSKKIIKNMENVLLYNFQSSHNIDDFNRNLTIVQERYPLLYNQFKNNADVAY